MAPHPSRPSLRRLRPLFVVAILAVALAGADTCGGSSPTESRRDCSYREFSNFNGAQNRSACEALAGRNGCQSFTFDSRLDLCTGLQCTSCNKP